MTPSPLVVRITDTGTDEEASVDGRAVARHEAESAREAALRTVLADLDEPRLVDIHTPAGVVLHVRAEPGGRLHVLGQSPGDPEAAEPDDEQLTDVGDADGDGERADLDEGEEIADGDEAEAPTPIPAAPMAPTTAPPVPADPAVTPPATPAPWPERDLPWPAADDGAGPRDRTKPTGEDAGRATTHPTTETREHGADAAPEAEADGRGERPGHPPRAPGSDASESAGSPAPDTPPDGHPDAAVPHPSAGGEPTPTVDSASPPTDPAGASPTTDSPAEVMPSSAPRPGASSRVRTTRGTGSTAVPRVSAPRVSASRPDRGGEGSPADPARMPGSTTESETETTPGWRPSPQGVMALLIVAGLVVMAGLGAAAVVLGEMRDREAVTGQTSTDLPFPTTPPDSTSAQALWASAPLRQETRVAVLNSSSDGRERVSFVSAQDDLVVVDAATGETRWSSPLPEGSVVEGPAATTLAATGAVAVRVDDHLLVWAVDDGRVLADTDLPAGSELVLDAGAPFLRIDAGRAGLVDSSGVRTVDLPEGATALAARGDGVVLAGGARGWWHLTPGTPAGEVTPWEEVGSPRDRPVTPPTVVAALGASVLLVHPDPGRARLVVHTDGAAGVRASFQSEYVPAEQPTWAPSPSGTWGVLGRTLVDLHGGRVTDLGEWRTVLIEEQQVYGLVGDALSAASQDSPPAPVTVRTSVVEASTQVGGVVRADTGEGPRIWLLPPPS